MAIKTLLGGIKRLLVGENGESDQDEDLSYLPDQPRRVRRPFVFPSDFDLSTLPDQPIGKVKSSFDLSTLPDQPSWSQKFSFEVRKRIPEFKKAVHDATDQLRGRIEDIGESLIPKKAIFKEAISKEAIPKEAIPKKTILEKAIPELRPSPTLLGIPKTEDLARKIRTVSELLTRFQSGQLRGATLGATEFLPPNLLTRKEIPKEVVEKAPELRKFKIAESIGDITGFLLPAAIVGSGLGAAGVKTPAAEAFGAGSILGSVREAIRQIGTGERQTLPEAFEKIGKRGLEEGLGFLAFQKGTEAVGKLVPKALRETKKVVEPSKKIIIGPDEIQKFREGKTEGELGDVLKEFPNLNEIFRTVIKTGQKLELVVPSRVITTIQDRPWFRSFKEAFNIRPTHPRTYIRITGEKVIRPIEGGQITKVAEKKKEPSSKIEGKTLPEPTKPGEVTTSPKEVGVLSPPQKVETVPPSVIKSIETKPKEEVPKITTGEKIPKTEPQIKPKAKPSLPPKTPQTGQKVSIVQFPSGRWGYAGNLPEGTYTIGRNELGQEIPVSKTFGTKEYAKAFLKQIESGTRPSAEAVKKELISEIEEALKKAPTEAEGTIVISIPGDGEFTLVNSKKALSEVLRRAKALRVGQAKELVGPSMAQAKARFKVKREFIPVEGADYVTDGAFIAKGKELPRGAKISERPPIKKEVAEDVFNAKAIEDIKLVRYQTGSKTGDFGVSPKPIVTNLGLEFDPFPTKAIFKTSKGELEVDQNNILYFHENFGKDLSFKLNENNTISVYDKSGERVGVIMPLKTEKPTPKEMEEPTKRVPSETAATDSTRLDDFEAVEPPEVNQKRKEFKVFDHVNKLIDKYAKRVGERYVSRGALGVYYPETENIRLNALNNLSTAAHEITHHIDFKIGIIDPLVKVVGVTSAGKPIYDPSTAKERKSLTDIYLEYYPGGKEFHALLKRMREGFATFIEKYVETPSVIKEKYPHLVSAYLTPGGKFYKPILTELIGDLRKIIAEYQSLDPLAKVGARVTTDTQVVHKDSFINFWENLFTEFADNLYPIEKLARVAGKHMTLSDPSLWLRMYNNSNAVIINNIRGKNGYWSFRNGEFIKIYDFNWKTLVNALQKRGVVDEFGWWLVARREYFAYQELDKKKEEAIRADKFLKEIQEYGPTAIILARKDVEEAKKKIAEFKRLNDILKKDAFSREVVEEAYKQHSDRFAKEAEMFDKLTRADLDMLNDEMVQLVSPSQYDELIRREGYASFKRDVYDEILGEERYPFEIRVGKTKVSSLIGRRGSQLTIINPLYSAIRNHSEATRKALKQIVYNSILKISNYFPELFQRLKLISSVDPKTKVITYPQEKDQNIIMAREDYKRVPFLVDSSIKQILDEVLSYNNVDIAERLMREASRIFTKGTTSGFPPFAATNLVLDQITAVAQTKNKYKPIYDNLIELSKALSKRDSLESNYFIEYLVLGGEKQTWTGWQDLQPSEIFRELSGEKSGIEKVLEWIRKGYDILSIPAKYSEISTRAVEYIKARKAGKPQIVALEEAGRVSVPFHHIGRGMFLGPRFGKNLIKSIPFFNPSIQVLAQFGRSLAGDSKSRQRAVFVTLAVTASMIGSAIYLMLKGSDEQKELYKNLEPQELANYLWFPSPDKKTLWKMRVPEQMGVFATLINMALADMLVGTKYVVGDYIAGGTAFIPDQFNVSDFTRMFFAWIPNLLSPAIEVMTGKKTWPRLRPLEPRGFEYKEPRFRYFDSTSDFAKFLGNKLNISPIKVDYLIEGYFGRVAKLILRFKETKNPFVKEFYFNSARNIQDFYEIRDKVNQSYKAYRERTRPFTPKEIDKLIKQKGILDIIERYLKNLRDIEEDEIRKNSESAQELRRKILSYVDQLKA